MSRLVKNEFELRKIMNKIVDSEDFTHGYKKRNGAWVQANKLQSKKSAFIRASAHAGVGGFVIGNKRTSTGGRVLYQVKGYSRDIANRNGSRSFAPSMFVPLFSVKKQRKVKPDKKYNHFMRSASLQSQAEMEKDFIDLAEKRLQRV